MAVRVLRDQRIHYSPSSQIMDLREGEVIEGDLGKWLEDNCANGVEALDPPDAATEMEPAAATSEPDPALTPDPPPPDPTPVHASAPDPDPLVGPDGPAGGSADDDPAPFEPADHNGPEVIAFAKAHPDQRAAILVAERAGKARTTVLTALAD